MARIALLWAGDALLWARTALLWAWTTYWARSVLVLALDRLALGLGRLTWGLESIILNQGCVDPFTLGQVCFVFGLGDRNLGQDRFSFGPGPPHCGPGQPCFGPGPPCLWAWVTLLWARAALLWVAVELFCKQRITTSTTPTTNQPSTQQEVFLPRPRWITKRFCVGHIDFFPFGPGGRKNQYRGMVF